MMEISGAVEYKNFSYIYLGVVVTLLWIIDYFSLLSPSQIIYPIRAKSQRSIKRYTVLLLGVIGLFFLSYAATGPRKALSYQENNIEVNDIIFVFDVSRSMLADDISPNRLEVAKKKLREFVSLRPKDRIGVVLFSEKVFTLLPLTTDLKLIDQVIGDINVGYLGSGTNIGDGLALGVARASQSETKNKIIILLTDGVSNVGTMTPLEAAEIAKKYNIKVYTIGIGTDDTAKIPLGNSGFSQRYQNIPGGSIDMETLQKISDMTSGRTYYANSSNALSDVFSEIEKLERTEIKGESRVVYEELYWKYLIMGFIFFLFAELMRRLSLREYI